MTRKGVCGIPQERDLVPLTVMAYKGRFTIPSFFLIGLKGAIGSYKDMLILHGVMAWSVSQPRTKGNVCSLATLHV